MSRLLKSTKGLVGMGLAALVVVVAGGWFLLVSPQKTKATDLKAETELAQQELATKRAALASPAAAINVRANDSFRLTRALPNTNDMASIILELERLAARHELTFKSLAPGSPMVGIGYLTYPADIIVQGRFAEVSGFLGDLRKIVRVKRKKLDARGRVYSITNVDLGQPESPAEFPVVKAQVTLNSFTFSPGAGAPPPGTSTTPSDDATVAAGATP